MDVKSFGYGTSTVVATKGATDTFAVTWEMLNCLGLADIILQCDPVTSLVKWGRKCEIQRTVIRTSPRRSHQGNGAVGNYQKQLQGPMHMVRHASWLIPRFSESDAQSPFYRGVERWEKDLGNPAPKLADKWKSAVWLGKSDLTDEHLVRTADGAVYARSVRRLADHSWSEENLRAIQSRRHWTSLQADPCVRPPAVPDVHADESGRREASGATRHNDDAWIFELKQRREAHRNTCLSNEDSRGNTHEERRRAHANGDRGFVPVEHGEHTPQRRDLCGKESSE